MSVPKVSLMARWFWLSCFLMYMADRVADVDKLEADKALCTLVRQLEPKLYGRRRSSRNYRHRGGRKRLFSS